MLNLKNNYLAALIAFLIFAYLPLAPETRASQATEIIPFKASYTLKRKGIEIGKVHRELKEIDNGHYVFESESKPIGVATFFIKDIIVERSHWSPIEDHFRPERYYYERSGGHKQRHVKLVFDWENNKVTNVINNDAWKMDVPSNVQDKLLYQLSIMYDLANANKELNYEVADGGRLKDYSFKILSKETISTEIGELRTVKIQRASDNRVTTIWCAIDRNFLPVRIEQNDEDGEFQLDIDSIAGL